MKAEHDGVNLTSSQKTKVIVKNQNKHINMERYGEKKTIKSSLGGQVE